MIAVQCKLSPQPCLLPVAGQPALWSILALSLVLSVFCNLPDRVIQQFLYKPSVIKEQSVNVEERVPSVSYFNINYHNNTYVDLNIFRLED